MDMGVFKRGTETVWFIIQAIDENDTPVEAEAPPTFIVVDESQEIAASGTCTDFNQPDYTGAFYLSFDTNVPAFIRGKKYDIIVDYTVDGIAKRPIYSVRLT